MNRDIRYHLEAATELRAEVAWYEQRHRGLGDRFEIAVDEVLDGIVQWPESGTVWPGWDAIPVVRTLRVADFPHRLIYLAAQNEIYVVAVAHEKREPGYWRDRVGGE